jgi:hypothetical protein
MRGQCRGAVELPVQIQMGGLVLDLHGPQRTSNEVFDPFPPGVRPRAEKPRNERESTLIVIL